MNGCHTCQRVKTVRQYPERYWAICVPDVTWWRTVTYIKGWMQMVFTPYDLFFWNKYDINLNIIDNLIIFKYIDKGTLRMLTLYMLGPLRHAWLFFPSSSSSMLPPSLLGVDCLSCFLSGGLALPCPLPLSCTHFPQVSMKRPTPPSGTIWTVATHVREWRQLGSTLKGTEPCAW
jgi:hypothetical protein